MSLKLGRELNRCYNIRQPFLNYYYSVGIYFNTSSNFLLFKVDNPNESDYSNNKTITPGVKINMFKNLNASKFCSTFLNLHDYRNDNLDIACQYNSIQENWASDIHLISSENIILNKVKSNDNLKSYNDCLTFYSFIFQSYYNEFVFIIAERQHIAKKLKRKIVRSTALQIATTESIAYLDEMNAIEDENKIKLKKDPFHEIDRY